MTRHLRRNFRGAHALVICTEGHDRTVLGQHLSRLGVTSSIFDGAWHGDSDKTPDLVFFDAEASRELEGVEALVDAVHGPSIALLGSDTPSSVSWVIERHICGYLTKPLRRAGILASLMIAHHAFEQRTAKTRKIERLQAQAHARQVVCAAAIELTDGLALSVDDAFRLLRAASMNRRISVENLCAMILAGEIAVPALAADLPKTQRNTGQPGSAEDRYRNS